MGNVSVGNMRIAFLGVLAFTFFFALVVGAFVEAFVEAFVLMGKVVQG